jgi:muconolactone delta-isomerase
MRFHVIMIVRIPHDADPEKIKSLSAREHERAAELQRVKSRPTSALTQF